MKKKILLTLAAFALVIASIPLFAAFEAHVINVTAKIENALMVSPEELLFGTVFPQEELNRTMVVALSQSFIDEERADDVNYFIRQKPKPRPDFVEEMGLVHARHWCFENFPGRTDKQVVSDDSSCAGAMCPPPNYFDRCYYNLCPFLSKHPDEIQGNDGSLDAFHPMGIDVHGRLAKSEGDTVDHWNIDLKVPCFAGKCDQGYFDWVTSINPDANPHDYMLDPALEHEVFGCDLWIEVTGISRTANLYVETGDDSTEPGELMGYIHFDQKSSGKFKAKAIVDSGYLNPAGSYVLTLNGPRNGSILPGSPNYLLATHACAMPEGWDGWWMRYTDNDGVTICPLPDPLPPNFEGAEGYYNFAIGVTGAQLEAGYEIDIALPVGNYTNMQFLVKDMNAGWNTILEHPAVGEGNVSDLNFIVE